jgi:hypothetical protein
LRIVCDRQDDTAKADAETRADTFLAGGLSALVLPPRRRTGMASLYGGDLGRFTINRAHDAVDRSTWTVIDGDLACAQRDAAARAVAVVLDSPVRGRHR